ncbi:endonuclease domain-containing protein [Microcoleus sp. CAWBG58]|uniref:endonuclease domain-containing protein n=1 Tax=Microcoleus sp. CAWBG58 TaxID=2841651 RepID=UPI0025FDDC27|nr:endonuclease domain-containing protein [Microcoleus sp. CAWBG58]
MPKLLHDSNFHLPYNRKLIPIAQQLRKNPTPAEKKLWQNFLRNFPVRVLRQRPIDNFIVDFYCAAFMLVIEVDGESHFTEQGKQHDAERTAILEGYGLTVVRFTNVEVFQSFQGVCQNLLNLIAADTSGQIPRRHNDSWGEAETLLSPPY